MYTTVIFQRVHIIFQQLHHCHYISMCIAVQIDFSIYTCVIIFLNVHQHYILAHTLVSLFSALHQYHYILECTTVALYFIMYTVSLNFSMYINVIAIYYILQFLTFQHVGSTLYYSAIICQYVLQCSLIDYPTSRAIVNVITRIKFYFIADHLAF